MSSHCGYCGAPQDVYGGAGGAGGGAVLGGIGQIQAVDNYLHDLEKKAAPPAPDYPDTVERLSAWIKSNFTVMIGPPRAYFEVPVGDALPFTMKGGDDVVARFVYDVIAYTCRDVSRDVAEPALMKVIWQDLTWARNQLAHSNAPDVDFQPVLFLRRPLEYKGQGDFETSTSWHKASIRLCIPGIKWPVAHADGLDGYGRAKEIVCVGPSLR